MPGIESVQGDDVRFTDGSSKRFDAVIAATGCAVDLHFLDPPSPRPAGRTQPLFLRVGRPHQRGMSFMGLFYIADVGKSG